MRCSSCSHLQLLRRRVPVRSLWLCWTVGPRLCRTLSDVKRQRWDYNGGHYISDVLTGGNGALTLAGLAVLFLLAGLDWSSAWSSGLTWGGSDWPEPDDPGWALHAWERRQTGEETERLRERQRTSTPMKTPAADNNHIKLWICSESMHVNVKQHFWAKGSDQVRNRGWSVWCRGNCDIQHLQAWVWLTFEVFTWGLLKLFCEVLFVQIIFSWKVCPQRQNRKQSPVLCC